MSAIDSTPENMGIEDAFFEERNTRETDETDAKISKIWLIFAAAFCGAIAIVTGVLAFTATLWLLIPSIPLFLASGALVWYGVAGSSPKRANLPPVSSPEKATPQEIQIRVPLEKALEETLPSPASSPEKAIPQEVQIRVPVDKALEEPLPSPAKRLDSQLFTKPFSLPHLIKNGLIEPNELRELFTDFAANATIQELIHTYEKIQAQIRKFPDYSIPNLSQWKEKLAQESHGLNYQNLVSHYSLPVCIRYSLIDKDELIHSFDAHAEPLPLSQIVEEYEKLSKQIELFPHFQIPFPITGKEKFHEETRKMKAAEIVDHPEYHIHKLFQYQVIDSAEYNLLNKIIDENATFQQLGANCDKELREKNRRDRDHAIGISEEKITHIILGQKDCYIQYASQMKTEEASSLMQMEAAHAIVSSYEKDHPKMNEKERAYFSKLKKNCEEACAIIKKALLIKKEIHEQEYQKALSKGKIDLQAARQLKIDAEREYDMRMHTIDQDKNLKLAPSREALNAKLSQINQEYDRLRLK